MVNRRAIKRRRAIRAARAPKRQARPAIGRARPAQRGGPGIGQRQPVRPGVGRGRPVGADAGGGGVSAPQKKPPRKAPWNAVAERRISGAHTTYGNTTGNIAHKREAWNQAYGLTEGYNDYQANPTSRAALLEASFNRANRGSSVSYAGQGKLYSGSLQNALNTNRRNRDEGFDALSKEHATGLQGFTDAELAAQAERDAEIDEAERWRIEQAQNAPLDPSTVPLAQRAQQHSRKARQLRAQGKPQAARKHAQKAKRLSNRAKKATSKQLAKKARKTSNTAKKLRKQGKPQAARKQAQRAKRISQRAKKARR